MTEKEKMLTGNPYYPYGKDLSYERNRAREITYFINMANPNKIGEIEAAFKKLLGKIGEPFVFETPFHCDYGSNIEIGNNFYANFNLVILDCGKVTIGDFVFLGPNVSILTVGHPVHFEPRNTAYEHASPINIGNNVWIGSNVVINPGVTIGNNSVIGSGSVVTKNIPSNVIAVGTPCKVLREITEKDNVDYTNRIKQLNS